LPYRAGQEVVETGRVVLVGRDAVGDEHVVDGLVVAVSDQPRGLSAGHKGVAEDLSKRALRWGV
jgi:hypothetical protein